jgi:hypothetical protein
MRGTGGVSFGLAASVLVGAGVVFGATMVDAIRVDAALEAVGGVVTGDAALSPLSAQELGADPNPGYPGSVWGGEGMPRGALYPRVTGDEILDAVNQDPFQPSRTPSPQRYLLPSERSIPTATRSDPRRRGPELRLVGAALGAGRGVAMIQVGDGAPLALVPGEFVEGYRLAAVDVESAIMEGEAEILTLSLMAQLEPQRGRSATQRGAAERTQGPQVTPLDALPDRVQEILQGLGRGGGMGPGGGMGARLQEILERTPGAAVIIRGGEGTVQLPPGAVRGGRGGGAGGLLP